MYKLCCFPCNEVLFFPCCRLLVLFCAQCSFITGMFFLLPSIYRIQFLKHKGLPDWFFFHSEFLEHLMWLPVGMWYYSLPLCFILVSPSCLVPPSYLRGRSNGKCILKAWHIDGLLAIVLEGNKIMSSGIVTARSCLGQIPFN